jgi:hypothetical protein
MQIGKSLFSWQNLERISLDCRYQTLNHRGCQGGNAVAIKSRRVLVAEGRTSKCQAQCELFIGTTNNELREGPFIRSNSG